MQVLVVIRNPIPLALVLIPDLQDFVMVACHHHVKCFVSVEASSHYLNLIGFGPSQEHQGRQLNGSGEGNVFELDGGEMAPAGCAVKGLADPGESAGYAATK